MNSLRENHLINNPLNLGDHQSLTTTDSLAKQRKQTCKCIARQHRRVNERQRLAALYRELAKRYRPLGLHQRYFDAAMSLESCSSVWKLEKHSKTGKRRAVSEIHCDNRFCPTCASRRSVRFMKKYQLPIERSRDEGKKILFLTLTLKNTYKLDRKEIQQRLWGNFKRLLRRSLLSPVQGALASMEITGNGDAGWHCHLHVIVISTDYIEQSNLSSAWRELTGDSFIVDIRAAKDLRELLKYPFKPQQIQTADDLDSAIEATFGLQMVRAYGCLRGADDSEVDESSDLDFDSDSEGEWELVGYFRDDVELRELWLAGDLTDDQLRSRGAPLMVH